MTAHQATLLALLEAHTPADAKEAEHLATIAAFTRREPACFLRTTYEPGHITGSAFIVDLERGLMLLHHHRKLDRWLQMGGHDAGELDAAATALREAREESGLAQIQLADPKRILDVDVHAIPAGKVDPAHAHLDVRFLVLASADLPLRMDAAESLALRWFSLEAASAAMNEAGSDRVIQKVRALRGGRA